MNQDQKFWLAMIGIIGMTTVCIILVAGKSMSMYSDSMSKAGMVLRLVPGSNTPQWVAKEDK